MLIRLLLIILFAWIMFYAWSKRGNSRPAALMMVMLSVVGIVATLRPEWSSLVAHSLGVGRGVDLVIYFYMVFSMAVFFKLYLLIGELEGRITKLARHVALTQAPKQPNDE